MKKRLNTKSIQTIPLMLLVILLMAAMATQPGCKDNQPASDVPVSIDERGGGEAGDESVDSPAEPEEVVAANEEWFETESVDSGVAITGWKKEVDLPRKLVIPTTIEGKKVIEISKEAFCKCSSLTSVVIPEGVKSIGYAAFASCKSLTSVMIPEGVEKISNFAFSGCSSLTSVVIPESVTSIEYRAFNDCSSLASVVIPKGVTEIEFLTFNGCSSLTSVVIPEGVEKIDSSAFAHSSAKIEVDPKNAVYSSVDGVLFDKDKKTLLRVPANASAYSIPEGVTSIGYCAFEDCKSLTSVVIPEGVTKIRNGAFTRSSAKIEVDPKNAFYSSVDGVLFDKDKKTLLYVPANASVYSIPEGVTAIGDHAFEGCSSLTSVDIPEGVTEIGSSAFADCSSLTSVVIPEGVTEIGPSAFANCSSLTSVIIPEGVEEIVRFAFNCCSSLTSVVIPESVKSIGYAAFGGCSSLTRVVIPKSVSSIENSSLTGYPAKFHVFKDSYAEKWARENNCEYEIIEEGGDVAGGEAPVPCEPIPAEAASEAEEAETHVAPCAPFWMCPTPEDFFITENVDDGVAITGYKQEVGLPVVPDGIVMPPIVIPSQIGGKPVVKIDTKAFGDCSSMMSVVIPESVSSIEDDSFEGYPAKFHVFKDSYAEKWARENNREYEIIEEGGDGANNEGVAPCEPIPAGEPVPPCEPVPPSPEAATPNDEPMPVEDGSEPSASEPTENELREWTDSTGKYRIKATLAEQEGSNVKLRREDGKRITMPISKLSEEDRNYLAKLTEATPIESEPSASEPTKNELREWTDSTGAYRIKATYEGREGSNVKLRREDGKRITLPISKLSDADQDYLNKL